MPSKAGKRSSNWAEDEMKTFLKLCKVHKVPSQMNGKKFKTRELFTTLMAKMKKHGFDRNTEQLVVKFKQLKMRYKKECLNASRLGGKPSSWRLFADMEELLADRQFKTEFETESPRHDDEDTEEEGIEVVAEIFEGSDSIQSTTSSDSEPSTSNSRQEGKRKSFVAALENFSEEFFRRQQQLNDEFLAELEAMLREDREYDERTRKEENTFLQTLVQSFSNTNNNQ